MRMRYEWISFVVDSNAACTMPLRVWMGVQSVESVVNVIRSRTKTNRKKGDECGFLCNQWPIPSHLPSALHCFAFELGLTPPFPTPCAVLFVTPPALVFFLPSFLPISLFLRPCLSLSLSFLGPLTPSHPCLVLPRRMKNERPALFAFALFAWMMGLDWTGL